MSFFTAFSIISAVYFVILLAVTASRGNLKEPVMWAANIILSLVGGFFTTLAWWMPYWLFFKG